MKGDIEFNGKQLQSEICAILETPATVSMQWLAGPREISFSMNNGDLCVPVHVPRGIDFVVSVGLYSGAICRIVKTRKGMNRENI